MNLSKRIAVATVALAYLAVSPAAFADDDEGIYNKDNWPLSVNERPLTLGKGMLELSGDTLLISLNDGNAFDPIYVAPDIRYAVDNKLTVGIVHRNGLCIAGDECDNAYDDVGLEALYGVMVKGSMQLAFRGGVAAAYLDPFVAGLNLGFRARIGSGTLAIVLDPTLYVGLIGRTSSSGDPAQEEVLDLPVFIQYQLNKQTMVFLHSGLLGPLSNFGDFYQIPVGLGATFAVNNRLDFGVEVAFQNVGPNDDLVDSFDQRWAAVRLALRL